MIDCLKSSIHWMADNGLSISTLGLLVVAIIALCVAWSQAKATRLLTLLNYIESEDKRRQRWKIHHELYKAILEKDPINKWWDNPDNKELEKAASAICASFDILGRLPRGYRKFFTKHWTPSIVDNHDILNTYLIHRRVRNPAAYSAFTKVFNRALPLFKRLGIKPRFLH